MSVKVKICGITNPADASLAVEAGADAIGLMFYEGSPRKIGIREASAWAASVPPYVLKVGVFVNPSADEVVRAITECQLNMVQFHGDEPPEFCMQFGILCMKAFRVRDRNSLLALRNYPTDAWLLDTFSPKALGGTGERFDWNLAVEAKKEQRPVFLAGGLTPENVADAVRVVEPFGIDVSSGVEASPGRKDPEKVRAFIRAAKGFRAA